jgi:hypothetical protein
MRSVLIRWRFWLWLIERDYSDEACAFFWILLSNDSPAMLAMRGESSTFESDIMPVVRRIRRKVDGEE